MIRNITILLLLSLSFGTITDIDDNEESYCLGADSHASGVYFVKMLARPSAGGVAGEYVDTQKLMLIK